MNELEKRFKNIQEAKPSAEDLEAICRIDSAADSDEGITLEQMDSLRREQAYSGKISLRVPKTLHMELAQGANSEGVSLNQYILYKLAK